MSTELKQAAQHAVDAFDAFGDADDFASLFELTQKMRALRTAIQQAEAQQPATPEPVEWLDAMLADARETFDADGGETPQVVRDVIEYVASWVTVYREKNHPAPSVPGDVVHLRNALILAANRLDRLTLELKYGSQARADAIERASAAMLAAKEGGAA